MLLVPDQATDLHLQLLSELAQSFSPVLRERLLLAEDAVSFAEYCLNGETMPQVSVRQLFEDNARKLQLVWVAGRAGGDNLLTNDLWYRSPICPSVGHLNFVHPNRVQVLGCGRNGLALRQLAGGGLAAGLDATLFGTDGRHDCRQW